MWAKIGYEFMRYIVEAFMIGTVLYYREALIKFETIDLVVFSIIAFILIEVIVKLHDLSKGKRR